MKKFTKVIAALMLMTAVIMTACTPENDPNNNGNDNGGGNNSGGNGTYNGHDYVDLGLPSGTLWASCNVGATTPEGYGDYFAWGETTSKTTYNESNYKFVNGEGMLTKYCDKPNQGYNGFTDNLTTLLPEDDAATANWGNSWQMPTKTQWKELYQYTTHVRTTQNGVYGSRFTANNGNSIFLPAAGACWNDEISDPGNIGYYWSSILDEGSSFRAWYFYFTSDDCDVSNHGYRDYAFSVRPVRSSR